MSSEIPAVEAEGLSKSYGDRPALEGLSFTVHPGELVGVLGPNGAGKTTAIRILTTILAPDAGRFTVAGAQDRHPAEIRARIGVLPERSALAIFLATAGLLVSMYARSNRTSLAICLLGLLALFAPTQLPGGATRGPLADLLLHVNPATSAERFVNRTLISASPWGQELEWLISPLLGALLGCAALFWLAGRLRLSPGEGQA